VFPAVASGCGQAVINGGFDTDTFSATALPSPWNLVRTQYMTYQQSSTWKRSGTRSVLTGLTTATGTYLPGALVFYEMSQADVVVCPNTVYRYDAYLAMVSTSAAPSCQLTVKVNGVALAAGSPTAFSVAKPFVGTTAYYQTGDSETDVKLQVMVTCSSGIAYGTTTIQAVVDDVSFFPVSFQGQVTS
jgi:hypothetical protein